MCPSLIEIGSKTAEKNSVQTNKQTDRHYENNGHLAVNQLSECELYLWQWSMEIDYVNERPFVPGVVTFLGIQLHAQCKIAVYIHIKPVLLATLTRN